MTSRRAAGPRRSRDRSSLVARLARLARGFSRSSSGALPAGPPAPLTELLSELLAPHREHDVTVLVAGGEPDTVPWASVAPRARIVPVQPETLGRADVARLAREQRPLLVLVQEPDDDAATAAFRTLWPAVRGGGWYVARTPVPLGVRDIARGVGAGPDPHPPADDFEAHCRATVRSVRSVAGCLVLHRRRHHRWYTLSRVADEASASWVTDVGAAYDRIPAETVAAPVDVAEALRELVDDGPVRFDPATSAFLTDVTVHGTGPAVTAGGRILDETLNCARNVRRTSHLYRPYGDEDWVLERPGRTHTHPPLPPGRHYVLLKQTWDRNFGHWLLDAFPKLALLEGQVDVAECVLVVNNQSDGMRRVVLDALALAGIEESQVLFTDAGTHHFPRILVPGTISRHPVAKAPRAIRFLEAVAEGVPGTGPRRVYVSRNAYDRRRLLNEDELLTVLADHDYTVVRPETLTLHEQIAAFRDATHVIGNMGAGLSNLAFSRAGVSVLALATQTMKHDFFYDLVCHKAGRYRGLQGRAPTEEGPPHIGSDFTVDVGHFRDCLAWLHEEAEGGA